MSHSPLALAADSNQLTSSPGLSSQHTKSGHEPGSFAGSTQHPTATSPTNAELAVILRPYLLG